MANLIKINLDIKKDSYEILDLMQDYTYNFHFNVVENGKSVDLQGTTLKLELARGNGTFIVQTNDIGIEGNIVKGKINKTFTSASGRGKMQLILTEGEEIFGSWVINCNIKRRAIAQAIENDNVVTVLEKLDSKIIEAIEVKKETEELVKNGGAATKKDVLEIDLQVRQKANQTDLEVERARINNLATLKEGSTTGDAELIDARVGFDGIIYDDVGNSIRSQILDVSNPFNYFILHSYVDNKYLRPQDGEIRENVNFFTSDFIKCGELNAIKTLYVTVIALYDINKTFISAITPSDIKTITEHILSDSIYYYRICLNKDIESLYKTGVIYHSNSKGYIQFIDTEKYELGIGSIPQTAIEGLENMKRNISAIVGGDYDLSNEMVYETGIFLRPQDGTTRTGYADFKTSGYLNVDNYKYLILNGVSSCCFYSDVNTFISSKTENGAILIPESAKKYRICVNVSTPTINIYPSFSEEALQIIDFNNSIIKDDVISISAIYGLEEKLNIAQGVNSIENLITVGKSGCNYSKIQQAVISHDSNEKTIQVFPGTYKEKINTADNANGNKGTIKSLVGLDRTKCRVAVSSEAYGQDTLWVSKGYFSNMSFINNAEGFPNATTGGYALHIDNNWMVGSVAEFDNCYFYSEKNASAGIGTRPSGKMIFRDCIFESHANGDTGAVYFHNSADSANKGNNQILEFHNCIIYSKNTHALLIKRVGDDTNTINLTMANCTIYTDSDAEPILVDDELYTGISGNNVIVTERSHGNNIDIKSFLMV